MLIWGSNAYTDRLGYVIWECPECGITGPFTVYQLRRKFTLYFVPTFSYSNKQAIECGACKAAFEVPKDMKKHIAESIISQEELSKLIASVSASQAEAAIEDGARSATKLCPYCAEEIKAAAKYCRFCQHDLEPDS